MPRRCQGGAFVLIVCSHLAELNSALLNKVSYIDPPLDNVAIATQITASLFGFNNTCPDDPYGGSSGVGITIPGWGNGVWGTQMAFDYNDRSPAFRQYYSYGQIVNPWIRLATATPPEEIPLNLAAGISVVASHPALFWKNQFGEVTVVVSASKATPFIDTEVIATLPEGFRPKYTMIFPCVASDTRDTGFLYMDRLGAIQVSFGSKSEKNVIACFSFVAAP